MATQLQIRRGTSTQVAAFTGAEGEIVVNTTNDSVHVNDGSTQGGFELARVDGSNWNVTNNISTTGSVTAASLVVDTTTLVVDATNNRVGAGVASPQSTMHVLGTLKVATGNAQGILGLGEGAGTTVNVGIWRGAANNPTSDGNFLNLGGYDGIVFAASAAAIGSQTEAMRILSNQRVSIGGTSSNQLLNVTSSTTPALEFTRGSGNATIGIDNGNSIAVGGTAGDLILRASGTTGATKFTDSGGNITMTLTEANNVGITGQTNPTFNLDGGFVTQTWGWHLNTSYQAGFTYTTTDRSLSIFTKSADNADYIKFSTGGSATERGRLTAAGNFGLGISSPSAILHVKNTTSASQIKISDATNTSELQVAGNGFYFNNPVDAGTFIFRNGTGLTERMRVDSNNVLVGTTTATNLSDGTGNDGVQLNPSGTIAAARTSNVTAVFNRLSSDGEIARFNKDGSTIGSIGVTGSGVEFFIDGAINVNRSGLEFSYQAISPRLGQADANGTVDLGRSARRFRDAHLSRYLIAHQGAFLGGNASGNFLHEYEEGTFTPNLSFGGVASGISWNVQAGRYTKIGRLVLVGVYLYTTGGRGSQTGNATVNMPFLSEVGHPDLWVPISNRSGITAGSNKTLTIYFPQPNFGSVRFYAGDNGGGANAILTHASFAASGTLEVSFTISYMSSQ